MDYRIVTKEAFTVVGKFIPVSCVDGENSRRIPQLWQECGQDGTLGRLAELGSSPDLLGVCMEFDRDMERFTYVIGVEGSPEAGEAHGFASKTIPAATWAVFASVGPMPGAIQNVWNRVYQEWFPATGYEHADGPELEVYPPGDITAADYHCEVWVPIVKK